MKKHAIALAILSVIAALSVSCSRGQPDLALKSLECREGKFFFTVTNKGNGPLPENWVALASVYIDGVVQEDVDLKNPTLSTEGGIQEPGGTSHYLTLFDIEKPTRFDVYVDYSQEIKETDEDNNAMENVYIEPCALPDLAIENIGVDEKCHVVVTIRNKGEGSLPVQVWDADLERNSGLTLQVKDKERVHVPLWEIDLARALDNPGNEILYTSDLYVTDELEITAVVDAEEVVIELSEDNNTKSEILSCGK